MTPSDDLEQMPNISPFSGDWQGNGTDSAGNEFTFAAKASHSGDNKYRVLILDKLDTLSKPIHIRCGGSNRNPMKNPDRDTVSRLDALPNIGKAMAADLHLIGIHHPKKLLGMEPLQMYEALCKATGKNHDPCVIDVFMSAVHFMEGGEPLPWWSFTQARKKQLIQQRRKGERM